MLKHMKVFAVDLGKEYGVADKFPDFGSLLSTVIFNVYIVAGVIFLILLIFGGITFIIGAGGSSEKKQQSAKTITAAITGFIVIFTSYFIIQLIEVITGVQILNPGF